MKRCDRCRRYGPTEAHHVQIKGMGSPKSLRDGRTVDICAECHRWIHANPLQALTDGWRELRNVGS